MNQELVYGTKSRLSFTIFFKQNFYRNNDVGIGKTIEEETKDRKLSEWKVRKKIRITMTHIPFKNRHTKEKHDIYMLRRFS